MKKIFLSILLLSLSSILIAGSNEYRVWGNLYNGGIESLTDQPQGSNTIGKGHTITPNFRGGPFTFSIDVKSNNLKNYARLWVACDDSKGNQIIHKQGYVIRGSKNWNRYNVAIQNIPNNTSHISFGVSLNGAGKIEVKNYMEYFGK